MTQETAEKVLSRKEADEVAYYNWAIKHHMELIENFRKLRDDILKTEE